MAIKWTNDILSTNVAVTGHSHSRRKRRRDRSTRTQTLHFFFYKKKHKMDHRLKWKMVKV